MKNKLLKRAERYIENAKIYRLAAIKPNYPGQEITFLESAKILEAAAKRLETKVQKRGEKW